MTLALGLCAVVFGLAWFELKLRIRRTAITGAPPPMTDLPANAVAFLDELESHLDLPESDRVDVRAELANHIADSTRALQDEGLDAETSLRETLARLGRPASLATEIALAHRTTRRLVAGAVGGVFSGGRTFVEGAAALAIVAALAVLAGGQALWLQNRLNIAIDSDALGTDAAIPVAALAVTAFVAGRRAIGGFAGTSRRDGRAIRWLWAAGGAGVIAAAVLFVVPLRQSWFLAPFEATIPLAFAAGCLFRPHRPGLPVGVRALFATPVVVALVAAGVAYATGQPLVLGGDAASRPDTYAAPERMAPLWLDRSDHTTATQVPCVTSIQRNEGRTISAAIDVCTRYAYVAGSDSATSLSNGAPGPIVFTWTDGTTTHSSTLPPVEQTEWRDVSYEIWRAEPVAAGGCGAGPVSPIGSGPFTSGTVHLPDGLTFDLGQSRNGCWLLVLTAHAPDGSRYRLSEPTVLDVPFQGTLWDWLTADA